MLQPHCQVQQEILQKRREEKKAAIEAVKKFRKGVFDGVKGKCTLCRSGFAVRL